MDEDKATLLKMGLTLEQVSKRASQGLINSSFNIKTKSFGQIIFTNVCSLFNFINLFLAICVFMVHSYKNMLFFGVVFFNILIGIIQEVRAKLTIDRLTLLSCSKAKVIRDGLEKDIDTEFVVKDDILIFERGNQICADCRIIDGDCEADESILTGESESVLKQEGDLLLSGSFIVSGKVFARAERVGKESYINGITGKAKYLKKTSSEMLKGIRKIIRIVSVFLLPIAVLLYLRQLYTTDFNIHDSVVATVAAVIGMMPSGLILLTSIVLAVSVVRLGKKNTLVQELFCIETLARVDVLCFDKTGTLTEGLMRVEDVLPLNEKLFDKDKISKVLCTMSASFRNCNSTLEAIKSCFYNEKKVLNEKACKVVEFSSKNKRSMVDFEKSGTYILGAESFVLTNEKNEDLSKLISSYSKKGTRVLVLAHSKEHLNDDRDFPNNIIPIALILLSDKIRTEAYATVKYFEKQGVALKVISGDDPATVSYIAGKAGISNSHRYIDASKLKDYDDIKKAALKYSVFGRVTPEQKLMLVKALKENGHTVAMTGDGVNDVLALKEADCSISMQSASDAARNVSNIVLMDSDFRNMKSVVSEGRRAINNIQRSAKLYLTKTIYCTLLTLIFLFAPFPYPFLPIQLTLIGGLSIGIPSFVLALEPNFNPVKGSFLQNVLKTSLNNGFAVIFGILLAEAFGLLMGATFEEISTMSFLGMALAACFVLMKICKPINFLKSSLLIFCLSVFLIAIIVFNSFFHIIPLEFKMYLFLFAEAFILYFWLININKI